MMRYASGLAAAALALLANTAAAADFKVAVVDMQRALNECDAGKHAKDQVKGKFDKAQDQLKKQRDDLDKARGVRQEGARAEGRPAPRPREGLRGEAARVQAAVRGLPARPEAHRRRAPTSGIVEQLYGIVSEMGAAAGLHDGPREPERRAPLQRQVDRHHGQRHQGAQRQPGIGPERARKKPPTAAGAAGRSHERGAHSRDRDGRPPVPVPARRSARRPEPGLRAAGVKLVAANEPYFDGHFSGAPVFPGVLLCEALAQLGPRRSGRATSRSPGSNARGSAGRCCPATCSSSP